MPLVNLFRRLAARHAAFVTACAAILGLFQFLICAAVSSINLSGALQTILESMPPMMQSFVATQFSDGFSSRGLLAFGWNHPVAHAAGTAVAILLAARAIAGEIEAGIMEVHLSQPVSRLGYLATYGVFAMFALAALTTAGIAGTAAGQRLFGIERFAGHALLRLGLAYFALQSAWFGVTLALSAFGREGGRVASVAFVVALASYLAEAIGRLWTNAAFVLPWSPHHYYSPQAILVQGTRLLPNLAVLAAVAAAGVALAAWKFARRDLP
jgi:ABC-type transport system involved in multi-copper enzyme maturation permease subunit